MNPTVKECLYYLYSEEECNKTVFQFYFILTYKLLNGQAPPYICDIKIYNLAKPLRTTNQVTLVVSKIRVLCYCGLVEQLAQCLKSVETISNFKNGSNYFCILCIVS